jgi:hypothetical protein
MPTSGAYDSTAACPSPPWCGAVPVLGGDRLARGSHVQVRQDEAVGVDRPGGGELRERQGTLVRVQGPAPP